MSELQALCEQRCYPTMVISDNGMEPMSMAVLERVGETCADWYYIKLGKPARNAFFRDSTDSSEMSF